MNYYPYLPSNDTFMGYYVVDYNTVLNTPAPSNGTPILFVNLDQGMLWSKKLVNSQSYIQPYHISPINTEGSPKEPVKQEDVLNAIMTKLTTLEKNIEDIKGEKNESKPNPNKFTTGPVKE